MWSSVANVHGFWSHSSNERYMKNPPLWEMIVSELFILLASLPFGVCVQRSGIRVRTHFLIWLFTIQTQWLEAYKKMIIKKSSGCASGHLWISHSRVTQYHAHTSNIFECSYSACSCTFFFWCNWKAQPKEDRERFLSLGLSHLGMFYFRHKCTLIQFACPCEDVLVFYT